MSPVGSPHLCGRRRRPPTSYYGGRRPDLAPGSEVFWPIPVLLRAFLEFRLSIAIPQVQGLHVARLVCTCRRQVSVANIIDAKSADSDQLI
jgi:hypothetical protein